MALTSGTPGIGRDEGYWESSLQALPAWDGELDSHEVLLLAPHPDDEVLGCGGLLQHWMRSGLHLELWMVTDGEACFGNAVEPAAVAERRREEAREAHHRLCLGKVATRWLRLPDSAVAHYSHMLYSALRARVTASTTLVAPLDSDGHADHDAIGKVAHAIAAEYQLTLISYPIWFWHWGHIDAFAALRGTACQYDLSAAEQNRKREAIAAFESQINATEALNAVLPRRVLRHFRRPFEVVFREDAATDENQVHANGT